jgi:hypothetical protein
MLKGLENSSARRILEFELRDLGIEEFRDFRFLSATG